MWVFRLNFYRLSDPHICGILKEYLSVLVDLKFNWHSHQVNVVHKFKVVTYLVALHETVKRWIWFHQLFFCLVRLAKEFVVVLCFTIVPQLVLLLAVITFFLKSGCQKIKTDRLTYAIFWNWSNLDHTELFPLGIGLPWTIYVLCYVWFCLYLRWAILETNYHSILIISPKVRKHFLLNFGLRSPALSKKFTLRLLYVVIVAFS